MFARYFLLFSHILRLFSRIFVFTLISLIFIVRIYLTVFPVTTLFFLRNYTGNIDGTIRSVLKTCSAMFGIGIISFRLFINHNTISNVFIFRFLICHRFFDINDRHSP